MDAAKSQETSPKLQPSKQDDAETARLQLMKSLTFEQKLVWLDWAHCQVVAKYGWEAARQDDRTVTNSPQFEAAHLELIQQNTREHQSVDQ